MMLNHWLSIIKLVYLLLHLYKQLWGDTARHSKNEQIIQSAESSFYIEQNFAYKVKNIVVDASRILVTKTS